ncbi:MAG: hypothetical protein MJZ82_01195 [Paludibacteraceae bacterium]|nr:hypothetical protein [Paludibacteraceae bacterium]
MMITLLDILLLKWVVDPNIWGILIAIFAIYIIYLVRIKIACNMARNRHRSPLGWGLFSFFISPPLAWIILAISGNDDAAERKMKEEEGTNDVDVNADADLN